MCEPLHGNSENYHPFFLGRLNKMEYLYAEFGYI